MTGAVSGSGHSCCVPYTQVGSNSEVFWLWPVMVITASMPPELGRVRLPTSDLVLFFQGRRGSCCAELTWIWSGWPGQLLAKHPWNWPGSDLDGLVSCWPNTPGTDLDLIWMAWSAVGQTPLVQKHASVQESNAVSPLLVSGFQIHLHSSTDSPDLI